jgi:hypothetical protein
MVLPASDWCEPLQAGSVALAAEALLKALVATGLGLIALDLARATCPTSCECLRALPRLPSVLRRHGIPAITHYTLTTLSKCDAQGQIANRSSKEYNVKRERGRIKEVVSVGGEGPTLILERSGARNCARRLASTSILGNCLLDDHPSAKTSKFEGYDVTAILNLIS